MKNFMLGIVVGWIACKSAPTVLESFTKAMQNLEDDKNA